MPPVPVAGGVHEARGHKRREAAQEASEEAKPGLGWRRVVTREG